MDKATITRIYTEGFRADDFLEVQEDLHVIEGIVPDVEQQTKGGLFMPGSEVNKIAPTMARIFRIVKPVRLPPPGALAVRAGDVVIARNAMVDPLSPKQEYLVVAAKHVVSIIERAPQPEAT